jgi:predicted GNAT family N-acyltransferase
MTSGTGLVQRSADSVEQGYQTRIDGSLPKRAAILPPRIPVLVYSESDDLLNRVVNAGIVVNAAREQANPTPYPEIERCDFDSKVTFADRVAELARTEDALLIVSDRFAAQSGNGDDLAMLVRERSCDGKAVIALLALADPTVRHIALVDVVVDRSADAKALGEAMQRALLAIRYKIPPAERSFGQTSSIEVRPVDNAAELEKCLALRHGVYKLLGYSYDGADNETDGLELEYYDQSALHFIATVPGDPDRVAGTARLVVCAIRVGNGRRLFDTAHIRDKYRGLCEQVAAKSFALKKKLETGSVTAALPLLAAFDYDDLSPRAGDPVGAFCELSRVVVAEEFRGFGVSRLLVRACIAAAFELQRRHIVLECIPQHVRLYEKFGFTTVTSSKPRRAWGIDQLAEVMRLDLDDVPTNEAVQIAKRDVAMMQTRRSDLALPSSLCLCRISSCWENGNYANRGQRDCPRRIDFLVH